MQSVPFLVFLAVPIFAALVIDTEAFVPFLILFFVLAGLSAAHPTHDESEDVRPDAARRADQRREFPFAAQDRPMRQSDVVNTAHL